MAAIYTDHNVARQVAEGLRRLDHDVVTARDLGREVADDDEHLLLAAERGWVLLTHNAKDFVLLHGAWRRWAGAWNVQADHSGIIILPNWTPLELIAAMDLFLQSRPVLRNALYEWRTHRWVQRPQS